MNKLIRCKKGASSILVILLLVVLVVFGVAALTTALSNVRLGQKTADWNDKYYAAEAKANEIYAQIDKTLSEWQRAQMTCRGTSGPELDELLSKLEFDVQADIKEDNAEFTYEAWEDDIGIDVILSYDFKKGRFTVKQFKTIQQ